MVVATKFPSYVVRHPEKRVWLVHQFRQAYELDRTELGQFGESAEDRALRRKVQELDRIALGEATRLFAISEQRRGQARALDRPRRGGAAASAAGARLPLTTGPGDFVLSVSRLDRAKRIDLLLEAAAHEPSLRVVVAGDGPDRERLEQLVAERGLDGRVRFAGRVSAEELADLYATCSSTVYYAPVDEDFGMGPLRVVPLGQARDHRDRRRRAARHRRTTARPGSSSRPTPRRSPRRRSGCATTRDEAASPRPGGTGVAAARSRGIAPSAGCCREGRALLSPMPPERSGIADYAALLLPALRARCDSSR